MYGNNRENIKRYNYVPHKFNFFKTDNDEELYLGVELEIDKGGNDNVIAETVYNKLGRDKVYCMHDGSLANGFEITTHPMSYNFHKILPYKGLFNFLVKKGYKSHDTNTCGLHVHFNRSYFGEEKLTQDLGISKFLYIFEKFWDKVELIARRTSSYASRFYIEDNESILDLFAKARNSGKYSAINLSHKNTVEIRVFKGTLSYDTFMLTLKFVDGLVKISKGCDIYDMNNLTWDFIENEIGQDLKEYIIKRKEIEDKKKEEREKERLEAIERGREATFSNVSREIGVSQTFELPRFDMSRLPICPPSWNLSYSCEFVGRPTEPQNITILVEEPIENELGECFNINKIEGRIKKLKKEVKLLKRQIRRSNGLRRNQVQQQIQEIQTNINRLKDRKRKLLENS